MAEKATIARPYARAAFEHARQARALAAWSELLGKAAQVVADPQVARLLQSPHVTPDQLAGLVGDAAAPAGDAAQRNFVRTLACNRRLGLVAEIAAQFEALRADEEQYVDVEVVAALPVDAAQEQRLAGALRQRLGREVRLHTSIDASLIGGAIVRAGDLVIDGSLKGRLERLAQAMTA